MNRKTATILGILACGYVETKRSKKYRTFEFGGRTFMVGKSGGFRRTYGSLAVSRSFTDTPLHKAYEHIGRLVESQPNLTVSQCREIRDRYLKDLKGAMFLDNYGRGEGKIEL